MVYKATQLFYIVQEVIRKEKVTLQNIFMKPKQMEFILLVERKLNLWEKHDLRNINLDVFEINADKTPTPIYESKKHEQKQQSR